MKKVFKIILVLLLILFGLIIATGGIHNLLPSSVEISDISAERTFTTWDYTSGVHEEASKIFITYGIDSCMGVDDGIITQWVGYDKKGKVVFNETCYDLIFNDYDESYAEFDEIDEYHNYKNIGKIVKLELYIYKYVSSENEEVYGNDINNENFGQLLYRGETENIIDTPDEHYDVNDIPKEKSNKKTSSNNNIPKDDDSNVYGDYIGNSNTHKFHQSFCSWADNIKSGNKVSFSSRQDALDSGYSPCGHCNP